MNWATDSAGECVMLNSIFLFTIILLIVAIVYALMLVVYHLIASLIFLDFSRVWN